MHCRSTDTGARYGGDEFALVLPEAGVVAAESVACRIREKLRSEPEIPRLSVSSGVALYPRDGETLEKLLGAADKDLYRMKGRSDGIFTFSRIAACV
jgi:diguanylate cyclase (GGDEF)-like protein